MTAADATMLRALIDAASAPYQAAGRFAYHFARGKLKADPIFEEILSRGLLARRQHILDLGCGQGLLAAWLAAARREWRPGAWPHGWPEPPRPQTFRGIELVDRYAERARIAVGTEAEVIRADVRRVDFGRADAIVILDVLQYIAYGDQVLILERVRRALTADGVLLLRIGNAAGGLKFTWATWVDRMVLLGSGRGWAPLHCRSTGEWQELLARIGFDSEAQSMSAGTPFANVLIVATPRQSPAPVATPRRSPGLVAMPRQSPALIATPRESPGLVATPRRSPGLVATPRESPGAVATPRRSPGAAD